MRSNVPVTMAHPIMVHTQYNRVNRGDKQSAMAGDREEAR